MALLLCTLFALTACAREPGESGEPREFAHDYGVFLNYAGDLTELAAYQTVVIDAQYVSREDIAAFRAQGHTVYSYINVGALERFRSYYPDHSDLAIGPYEHWEEVWIDAADPAWQTFLLQTLAPRLLAKGIDGFFADNCDVYSYDAREAVLDGLTAILKGLRANGTPVILNGGDAYLDAYCESGGDPLDVASGVNQESVFTSIDWDSGTFGRADEASREYFKDYVNRCAARGLAVYLLEYTTDAELAGEIEAYCRQNGFHCYPASTLELTADAAVRESLSG